MPSTVQPMITTADLPRLQRFYTGLLDAKETERFPQDGAAFFVALRIGDSDLGLVSDADVEPGGGQRMLISVDVADVDGLLGRVEVLGGRVEGPPTDMPWGQRVVHLQDPDGNAVNLTQQL
ncbi:putative enzyme related to lactoylglutathione lyase [Pseudonocardia kunmingensis]|uniref:Putative enzyme related to lactoylglutathione lyase n=2 Tax=Pseudonocardia kunmingensis TaxID=630975 RepID=A0A543DIF9_9PSEU|nr:putative enzyme related to lactoylglutathione lyase [Pseudonocardia kunmingensis]